MNPTIAKNEYDGALVLEDPSKVDIILNECLSKPESAIIFGPIEKELWIFYKGEIRFPSDLKGLNFYRNDSQGGSQKEGPHPKGKKWLFETVEYEGNQTLFAFRFFEKINKIKKQNSIKIAIGIKGTYAKIYMYYRR